MDRLEKIVTCTSIALMVFFAALVLYAGYSKGIELPSHSHAAPATEGAVTAQSKNAFEVNYVAKMWAFDPAELVLPQNADVSFHVTAADVMHGFQVLGTNVNLMAVPGAVNTAHHRFQQSGEYLV